MKQAVRQSGGRPVSAAHYHLTLVFLGNVPADVYDGIVQVAHAVSPPAFTLNLNRYGYWPRSRIFWLGTNIAPPELANLVDRLWTGLETIGMERERRVFRPHLTLARKVGREPRVGDPEAVTWSTDHFVLVESVTRQEGAVYEVVAEFRR